MDVAGVIKDYIVREFMDAKRRTALEDDAPLLEEGIIDSLGIFVMVAFLEKEFGLQIQPEDVVLENFETVNAISNLVSARLFSEP